jgi:hypothetical protein
MEKLAFPVLVIFLFLNTSGCNNQKKKSDKSFTFDKEQIESDITISKSFIYLFPSPGEILNRFYNAELAYNEELLHDPGRARDYMTSRGKGLNLGIYITDMAYAALFSRNSIAAEYLEVVTKLSNDLDVANTAFESLVNRVGANAGNSDSLIVISNEAFLNVLEFLETAERENAIALITYGAYIESMYLALYSMEEYDENDPILRQISELKYPLENLLGQAESVSEDPAVQSILEYIRELNALFTELEVGSIKASVDEPGVITMSGGSLPDISAENFAEIRRSVLSTRAFIVDH